MHSRTQPNIKFCSVLFYSFFFFSLREFQKYHIEISLRGRLVVPMPRLLGIRQYSHTAPQMTKNIAILTNGSLFGKAVIFMVDMSYYVLSHIGHFPCSSHKTPLEPTEYRKSWQYEDGTPRGQRVLFSKKRLARFVIQVTALNPPVLAKSFLQVLRTPRKGSPIAWVLLY